MTYDSLITAYTACRRHKRGTPEALSFETRWESNLLGLWRELSADSYRIGPSTAFIVGEPVQREVFAAGFRDRIVHHWLMERLAPLLEAEFIADSYSCRAGKGTLFGIRRVQGFIRECSEGYTRDCWVLKGDLQAFFMSIDRQRLADGLSALIERKYEGEDKELVATLTRRIALYDPTRDCRLSCEPSRWKGLPRDKSLFAVNGLPMPCDKGWPAARRMREQSSGQTELFGRGLPIGNLTSQWFGNFYLTAFDRFVVETLGVKCYGRYVDDFVLVHTDKEFLKELVPVTERYLKEELALTLHPRKRSLQHYSKGVKFLGSVIRFGALHAGTRTKTNLYATIRQANRKARQGALDEKELETIRASVNSYFGLLRPLNSYRLRKRAAGSLDPAVREQVVFPNYRKMKLKNEDRQRRRERIESVLGVERVI